MAYPGQQYHSSHHGQNSAYPGNRPQYPPQGGGYQQQQQGGYGGPPPPGPPGGYGGGPGGYGGPPGGPPPPLNQYNRPQGGGGYQSQQGGYDGRSSGGAPYNAGGYGGGMPGGGPGHYMPPGGPPPHAPPTQMQHYGPQYQAGQGQGGGQQQPFFQYSQCTGKRKALLIGINYAGTSAELRGCINDVHNVKRFITTKHGYREDDIVVLTDDTPNARQQPTRANILQAMSWLVQGAQPNDALFFHYSGHGGQAKDLDGDEDDGYDETIYPVDHARAGQIIDDEMHAVMVMPLAPGVRLTAIFDSCHSGTALDLPYVYSTEGKIKEPNLLAEAGQGLLGAGMSYLKGDMSGLFKGLTSTFKQVSGAQSGAVEKTRRTKTSPADVISFSGCKDEQTSADATEAGKATGAMSYAFIEALTQAPNVSYQTLLQNVRAILSAKYSQKPQLSASHPIDVTVQFIL